MCRSPLQRTFSVVPECFPSASSMWSRKPMPVLASVAPAWSRSQVTEISVSLVVRLTVAERDMEAPAMRWEPIPASRSSNRAMSDVFVNRRLFLKRWSIDKQTNHLTTPNVRSNRHRTSDIGHQKKDIRKLACLRDDRLRVCADDAWTSSHYNFTDRPV